MPRRLAQHATTRTFMTSFVHTYDIVALLTSLVQYSTKMLLSIMVLALHCRVLLSYLIQGGYTSLKGLEKIIYFSRTWKVLENKIGP